MPKHTQDIGRLLAQRHNVTEGKFSPKVSKLMSLMPAIKGVSSLFDTQQIELKKELKKKNQLLETSRKTLSQFPEGKGSAKKIQKLKDSIEHLERSIVILESQIETDHKEQTDSSMFNTSDQESQTDKNPKSKINLFFNNFKRHSNITKYLIQEVPVSYIDITEKEHISRGEEFSRTKFEENKSRYLTILQSDQEESLLSWINYFQIEYDSGIYEDWFIYHAINEVMKMDRYGRPRNSETVSPFPQLDQAIVSIIQEQLVDSLNNTEQEFEFQDLNFQQRYAKLLKDKFNFRNEFSEEEIEKGKWITFTKGQELELSTLVKNTIWCTAAKTTAKTQLEQGDFEIFVIPIEEGGEIIEVPAIAIHKKGDKIEEVRGTQKQQNLSNSVQKPLKAKLETLPDGAEYLKKTDDMEKLTLIYDSYKAIQKQKQTSSHQVIEKQNDLLLLTKEQLTFLYQSNCIIEGFGYETDPRIKEIIDSRDIRRDLAIVYDVSEDKIGLGPEDLEFCSIYFGDLVVDKSNFEQFKRSKLIAKHGSLTFGSEISSQLTELPFLDGFIQNGLMDLMNTNITRLPKNYIQNGYLDLTNSQITELPEGFVQKSYIELVNCKLTSLPEDFVQTSPITLSNNPITHLPDTFKQNDYLNLSETLITQLPEGFIQNGELRLGFAPLKNLPKGFIQTAPLVLSNTLISELPEGFTQGGSLFLNGTYLSHLPEGFTQNGALNLSDTSLTELPKGFKQNGPLYMSHTDITTLPEGFEHNAKLRLPIEHKESLLKSFKPNPEFELIWS
jgi:hypothetical protein